MELKLKVCDVRGCEAMCCHDGVYLSAEDEKKLHALVERTPSLRARLPAEYVVEGTWQGQSLGRKTATRPHDYRIPAYPAHFPRTRCVFADEQGWCELEKLGRARGRHRWHYKPNTCWMFPLDDEGGEAVPPSPDPADDPYRVRGYPGYVSVVPCGRHDPSGRPWRQALAQELRFHAHRKLFPALAVVLALALTLILASPMARAEEWPEMHVGVAIGQANIRVDQQLGNIAADLLRDHSAWSVSFGTRPIPWFGAELAYMDFGKPAEVLGSVPNASSVRVTARQQGIGGFLLGFVPLSTTTYEPYAKVGYIRLHTRLQARPSGTACFGTGCNGFTSTALGNVFAWGGGLQLRMPIDALAVHLEYLQLEQRDGRPHLVTAALLWRF